MQFIVVYTAMETELNIEMWAAYWVLIVVVAAGYLNLAKTYNIWMLKPALIFFVLSQACYFACHSEYIANGRKVSKLFILFMLSNKTFYLLYLISIQICMKRYKFFICLFTFGIFLLSSFIKYVL